MSASVDGTPDGVREAYLAVTGGGDRPRPALMWSPARRVAGVLFGLCTGLAAANAALATGTGLRLAATASALLAALATVALLAGQRAVGAGFAIAIGFLVFGQNITLLSFHATDRYDMLALAGSVVGLVAACFAVRDRVPPVRTSTPLGWWTAAIITGFGTVTALDLPWYRIDTGGGPAVDCCPVITDLSGWPMVATLGNLFVLAMLLVWAAGVGRTTRTSGAYLGIALAGLVDLVGPLYAGLTVDGQKLLFGAWLAAGVLVPMLLYGLYGLRRSLPPPVAMTPRRLMRPPPGPVTGR